jgi:hypothetical protein
LRLSVRATNAIAGVSHAAKNACAFAVSQRLLVGGLSKY